MEVTPLSDAGEWRVGNTTFVFDYGVGSTADRFLIRKPPDLVALYVDLAARFQHANIVELGIAAGGGTALISLLMEPSTLIACELGAEPVAALTDFVEALGLSSVVRPFYGVDQADRDRLRGIIGSVLPGQQLDLVIDDASHLYEATRSSFEVLFPLLRTGGVFIIEDWAADYAYAARIESTLRQSSPAAAALRHKLDEVVADQSIRPTPLPRIGVELLQICGASKEVVKEIRVNAHWIVVERGAAELDPIGFRLRDHAPDHWGWLTS